MQGTVGTVGVGEQGAQCWARYLNQRRSWRKGEENRIKGGGRGYNWHSSWNIIWVIKSRMVRWVGHVASCGKNPYTFAVNRLEGKRLPGRPKRTHVDNLKWMLGVHQWIILQWMLKNRLRGEGRGRGTHSSGSGQAQVACYCQQGNKLSDSIKRRQISSLAEELTDFEGQWPMKLVRKSVTWLARTSNRTRNIATYWQTIGCLRGRYKFHLGKC